MVPVAIFPGRPARLRGNGVGRGRPRRRDGGSGGAQRGRARRGRAWRAGDGAGRPIVRRPLRGEARPQGGSGGDDPFIAAGNGAWRFRADRRLRRVAARGFAPHGFDEPEQEVRRAVGPSAVFPPCWNVLFAHRNLQPDRTGAMFPQRGAAEPRGAPMRAAAEPAVPLGGAFRQRTRFRSSWSGAAHTFGSVLAISPAGRRKLVGPIVDEALHWARTPTATGMRRTRAPCRFQREPPRSEGIFPPPMPMFPHVAIRTRGREQLSMKTSP